MESESQEAPTTDRPGAPMQTCERCGGFAPLYELWGRKRCQACLDRRSDIELRPITPVNLFKDSLALTREVALPALLIVLAFGIPGVAASFVHGSLER